MFDEDLKSNKLPQWMFITPNMTNCGHDSSVRVAGKWVRRFLEPLLDNPHFMNNTVVVLSTFIYSHFFSHLTLLVSNFLQHLTRPRSTTAATRIRSSQLSLAMPFLRPSGEPRMMTTTTIIRTLPLLRRTGTWEGWVGERGATPCQMFSHLSGIQMVSDWKLYSPSNSDVSHTNLHFV